MKYILEDRQLFDLIYKFIDSYFTEDNIRYEYGYNYDTDKTDKNLFNFFGDMYSNNEEDDWYFEYISEKYYERLGERDLDLKNKWLDKSPLLEFVNNDIQSKLNGFFSHFWKPVFEKWFIDKFPELPVKTFVYLNL